ncbi:cytochrome ubiquinol oxidase subunit I [Brachybacterium sp. GPGPB12]|uniref:cytochrome ubiquinol oxidase subunit I n=1 Tax=Brachybacterium sp. GPGPB12 TaxID=3023517 RepID=UPI0031344A79
MLTNVTAMAAFPHVVSGAWLVAGAFLTGVASWHMVRHHRAAREMGLETEEGQERHRAARDLYRPTVRFGVVAMFVSAIVLVISGDFQAQIMFKQRPMKMASAEALCETETGASFSILTIGGPDAFAEQCGDVTHLIEVPYVTSFLATHSFDATRRASTTSTPSTSRSSARLRRTSTARRSRPTTARTSSSPTGPSA